MQRKRPAKGVRTRGRTPLKFIDEYRRTEDVKKWAAALRRITSQPWSIMEVCGGQTHSILKFGVDTFLPPKVEFIHGPGCPVCVTPAEMIDKAIEIACRPNVIFCSFGDMLRVPRSSQSLLSVKAKGHDVRLLYSPLDGIKVAKENTDREVVFFAVGFETTAPANAMAIYQASELGLKNFSFLVSHVLVPPAMRAMLETPQHRISAFLAAGHVCTVMGFEEYLPISSKYRIPIVVTGFEPVDILQGTYMCIKQLEEGRAQVENQYARSVSRKGNLKAQDLIKRVFTTVPRKWRGLGTIDQSGLSISEEYALFDAEKRFCVESYHVAEPSVCISGEILQGLKTPPVCEAFGTACTPEHPLGAPMVSTEGACSAYYRYRKSEEPTPLKRKH